MGELTEINSIAIGFLQDIRSWIFFPKMVHIFTSEDGINFNSYAEIITTFSDSTEGTFIHDFKHTNTETIRHIKIIAENYGVCPDWHLGAGGITWLRYARTL